MHDSQKTLEFWANALERLNLSYVPVKSILIELYTSPKGPILSILKITNPDIHIFLMSSYSRIEEVFPPRSLRGQVNTEVLQGFPDGTIDYIQDYPDIKKKSSPHFLQCQDCQKWIIHNSETSNCPHCGKSKMLWISTSQLPDFIPREPCIQQVKVSPEDSPETKTSTKNTPLLLPEKSLLAHKDLFESSEATRYTDENTSDWEALLKKLSKPVYSHPWPEPSALEALSRQYPNFSEVITQLVSIAELSPYRKNPHLNLRPILLVGPPSCGKTSFSQALAEILVGQDWHRIDMGQSPPHFELTGSHRSYRESSEGRILNALIGKEKKAPVWNPLVVLDEVDKINTAAVYNSYPTLLSLLEKSSSQMFQDNYFKIPLDASGIIYLATANDVYTIPEPLKSRFQIFFIKDYSKEQVLDAVVPHIYSNWKEDYLPEVFPEEISPELKDKIYSESAGIPRQMHGVLDRMVARGEELLSPKFCWSMLQHEKPKIYKDSDTDAKRIFDNADSEILF